MGIYIFFRVSVDKVCSTNDDEHCNVESSLLILFIIRNLVYVQVLLQVAHLQSCLVELCPL